MIFFLLLWSIFLFNFIGLMMLFSQRQDWKGVATFSVVSGLMFWFIIMFVINNIDVLLKG